MESRIISKGEFFIIGFQKEITLQFSGENKQIESLQELMTEERKARLLAMNDTEPKGIISVSADFSDRTREGSTLKQYLGIASSSGTADGFDVLHVPASCWAVFSACGRYPEALQDTWASIYSEWLSGSGYELTGGAEILWNESDDTSRDDFRSEIWIPVRPSMN